MLTLEKFEEASEIVKQCDTVRQSLSTVSISVVRPGERSI